MWKGVWYLSDILVSFWNVLKGSRRVLTQIKNFQKNLKIWSFRFEVQTLGKKFGPSVRNWGFQLRSPELCGKVRTFTAKLSVEYWRLNNCLGASLLCPLTHLKMVGSSESRLTWNRRENGLKTEIELELKFQRFRVLNIIRTPGTITYLWTLLLDAWKLLLQSGVWMDEIFSRSVPVRVVGKSGWELVDFRVQYCHSGSSIWTSWWMSILLCTFGPFTVTKRTPAGPPINIVAT